MMASIVLGLLVFFVFISLRVSTPDMKLLYTDLTVTDSAAVAAKLEEMQIPYTVTADGSRISVSGKEVGRARMLLAQEGLPNGGSMGYEIFDKQSGFGTTNMVQNINQVRALEGELARTIEVKVSSVMYDEQTIRGSYVDEAFVGGKSADAGDEAPAEPFVGLHEHGIGDTEQA